MRLEEFIESTGISFSEFARRIGVHANTLRRIVQGKPPTLLVAVKIQDYTKGAVTCVDLNNASIEESNEDVDEKTKQNRSKRKR